MPKKYLPNQDDTRDQLLRAKYGLGAPQEYPPVRRPTFDPRSITPAVPGSVPVPPLPREGK